MARVGPVVTIGGGFIALCIALVGVTGFGNFWPTVIVAGTGLLTLALGGSMISVSWDPALPDRRFKTGYKRNWTPADAAEQRERELAKIPDDTKKQAAVMLIAGGLMVCLAIASGAWGVSRGENLATVPPPPVAEIVTDMGAAPAPDMATRKRTHRTKPKSSTSRSLDPSAHEAVEDLVGD